MKTNIQIKQSENKKTSAGKPYWRFLTNEGWISVFQKPIADKLNENLNLNGTLEVELTETESNGYTNKNITKIYGIVEGPAIAEEQKVTQGVTPSVAQKDAFAEQRASKEQSIYTSYTKDLFLGLKETYKELEDEELMRRCIALVKQAQKGFAN